MYTPKYNLLQDVHYFRDGKLFTFKVYNIIYAKDGIFPFEDLPDRIYYADDEGCQVVPESLASPTAYEAVKAEIQKLTNTLDSIPNDK